MSGSEHERALALANYLGSLAGNLKLPTRLRDVGITEADIEALAEDAIKQSRLLGNNPRTMSLDDVLAVYREVL
ncbi:L-1,2-propanediol oxidoreductase [compost metagenome]